MGRRRIGIAWVAAASLLATGAAAQGQVGRQSPQIGFVYPAGGQRGTTVDVTVGGQFLGAAAEVRISGLGVSGAVVDYMRPPNGKEQTEIREITEQARKKLIEQAKGGTPPSRQAIADLVRTMAKEKGITDKQLEAFARYMRERSDPKRQPNPQLAESVTVRMTFAPDAEPGPRELRLWTPRGLSNPLRLEVGLLGEMREGEPNNTAAISTRVPALPVVINGQIEPGDVDRFTFAAKKGQQIVAAVAARRLMPYLADAVPGWFQATATLYDAAGREVAFDDDYRFDPDPVLICRIPADGEYALEIRDAIYRGREDFVYRVSLGELPWVTSAFPLGGRRGSQARVALTGVNLPADHVDIDLSAAAADRQPFCVATADGRRSNVLSFAVGDLPEINERESDDAAPAALTLPVVVNGLIGRPGDRDTFRLHLRKDDRVVAEVAARRLGSPLDSLLTLTDAAGRTLALNDDHEDKGAGLVTHQADSLLTFAAPADGDYLLTLTDAQRAGGDAYGYRLRVSRPQPDFELRVAPSAVNGRGGDTVAITVCAVRRDGLAGNIRLRLVDAPAGFTLSGDWVPAGAQSIQLTLTLPARTNDRTMALKLVGEAEVDGRKIVREATAADNMMQAFIYHHMVVASAWVADVAPVRWAATPLRPAADVDHPLELAAGRGGRLTVKLPANVAAEAIRFELSDPPPGVSIAKLAPSKGSVDVIFAVDATAAKGGTRGNLILLATQIVTPAAEEGQPPPKPRSVALGTVPAIPFLVLAEPTAVRQP
ncbi:MAG: hypothetical protein BIFFINMI_01443 [Phycisphaerae bacterium]|nr:hypothetical protein [Phycisphaerae bacterium]